MSSRQASLMAALEAAREEASQARHEADAAAHDLIDAQNQLRRLEDQLKQVPAKKRHHAPSWVTGLLRLQQTTASVRIARPVAP